MEVYIGVRIKEGRVWRYFLVWNGAQLQRSSKEIVQLVEICLYMRIQFCTTLLFSPLQIIERKPREKLSQFPSFLSLVHFWGSLNASPTIHF